MNNNSKRRNCDNKNHDSDGDDESHVYQWTSIYSAAETPPYPNTTIY